MSTDIFPQVQRRAQGSWNNVTLPEPADKVLNERNYEVFSVLADVRNHYGVPPICPPKGPPPERVGSSPAPDDVFHSETWLTLAELQAYDWTGGPIWNGLVKPFRAEPYPLHEVTARFRETILPALAALGDPDDVRVQMIFDS